MMFLLDESADARLAPWLRSLGHDVTAIAVDHPASLKDREVLNIAHDEGRILITEDRDFGKLIFSRRRPHRGVIYRAWASTQSWRSRSSESPMCLITTPHKSINSSW